MVFGTIGDPQVDLQPLPPSQKKYPMVASVNSFEWLNKSCKHSRLVVSYFKLSPVSDRLLNSKFYQCNNNVRISNNFFCSFDSSTNADNAMSLIQTQPSLHRAHLDSASEDSYQHLQNLAFGHAVATGGVHPHLFG
ncbi:hypothetical protein PsorP6_001661 [Peronosclerospora sorghi]|uniref:Uncharacterized protein n=1 Tax=Peronosclerospora sorghi TaxID=230839 RepID=A0ACC0WSD1_9STRA|nr:hypothetical protein PsorP6_001661 [Peronosclerospora sorghi]